MMRLTDRCFQDWPILEGKIFSENKSQLDKWGVQTHTEAEWLMFTLEELGELADAIGEWQFRGGLAEPVVKEAIQTATLCLKIAEMFEGLLPKKEAQND